MVRKGYAPTFGAARIVRATAQASTPEQPPGQGNTKNSLEGIIYTLFKGMVGWVCVFSSH